VSVRRPLAAALCLLLLVSGAAPPVHAEDEAEPSGDDEIQQLRDAIAESRGRVGGHEREERDILELMEEIDRGLDQLRDEVGRAERRAEEAQAALVDTDAKLREVRDRMARTRREMSKRAVALYKAGSAGPLQLLFASVDVQELLGKASTLQRLLRYDVDLIARFERQQSDLLDVESAAARALVARDESRARFAARSRILDEERAEKRALLGAVRGDRSRERALLVELERAARALEETLAGLGDDSTRLTQALDGAGFEQRRGDLVRPVPGRIAERFGRIVDSDYQTATFRNGIEISAGAGDSVRAVARGQVRFAGWFRGYGKIVILDHGDGFFTVSGHLADIYVEVGDPIAEGDTLGTVGETGSLRGPSLYFEVRQGGSPLDPADWLATG
jgi:septal ring factor EnvC (AmiA/AmiB activator)